MKEKILEIYTDASNKGGYGIFFINPDETERQHSYKITYKDFYKELKINYKESRYNYLTSVQLELFAIYKALLELKYYLKKYDKAYLYTDSETSFNIIYELDKNKKGKIKKNKDIVIRKLKKLILNLLNNNINIEIRAIKSHCRVYGNEIADRLAKIGKKRNFYIDKLVNLELNLFGIKVIYLLINGNVKTLYKKI